MSDERVVIYHKDHGFWQCGLWQKRKADATIYPNEREAELVKLMRRLPHDSVLLPVTTN